MDPSHSPPARPITDIFSTLSDIRPRTSKVGAKADMSGALLLDGRSSKQFPSDLWIHGEKRDNTMSHGLPQSSYEMSSHECINGELIGGGSVVEVAVTEWADDGRSGGGNGGGFGVGALFSCCSAIDGM